MSLDLTYAEIDDVELFNGTGLNSTWTDIPGLTIGATNFTANTKYLIFFKIGYYTNADYDDPFIYFRVMHGASNYLPVEMANQFVSNDGNKATQYHLAFQYSSATPEDLKIQVKTENMIAGDQGKLHNTHMWAIDLDALGTEGVDWIYAENRTEISDGFVPTSEVTFTPAAEDWLFIGSSIGGMPTTFANGGHWGTQMYLDQTAVLNRTWAGRTSHAPNWGKNCSMPTATMFASLLSAVEQDWGVSARGTTYGKELFSSIFGMRLSAAEGGQFGYDTSEFQNPADTWEAQTTTQLTHTTAGPAQETIVLTISHFDELGAVTDIHDGTDSHLLSAPLVVRDANTYPNLSASITTQSVAYAPAIELARIGSVSAATVGFRGRTAANNTSFYDTAIIALDATTTTISGGGGGGGGGAAGTMMLMGVG